MEDMLIVSDSPTSLSEIDESRSDAPTPEFGEDAVVLDDTVREAAVRLTLPPRRRGSGADE
jgi:hypothetical protein